VKLVIVKILNNYIVVNSKYFNLEIRQTNNKLKENIAIYCFILREK